MHVPAPRKTNLTFGVCCHQCTRPTRYPRGDGPWCVRDRLLWRRRLLVAFPIARASALRHDHVACVLCDLPDCIGLVIWLLTYLVDAIPLPEPFYRVARIATLVISVLTVILLLLQFVGAIDTSLPRLAR